MYEHVGSLIFGQLWRIIMNRYGHSLRTLFGRGWWMGCLIQGFESTAPWIVWPGTFSKRRAACRAPRGCLGQFNQFNRKGYPLVMTNIAIENDHRNSGFSHESWWFSIAMLVITKGYEDQKTTFFPFFPRFFCIMIIMALGCTRQPVELQPWFHEDEFWTLCVVNGSEDPLI